MGKADLHIHTNASDGAFAPADVVAKAKEKGLESISITDHDTIAGYVKAGVAAKDAGLELIPGVELSCSWRDREIHLLAYAFDPEHPAITGLLARQRKARILRMKRITEKLAKEGIDINYDEVAAEANGANIGRPHAARVLISKGVVASVQEAFIRYLSNEKLTGDAIEFVSLSEAIEAVRAACGVTSLAHPGAMYTAAEIDALTREGIDGIETIHPSHNFSMQRLLARHAEKQELLCTGGSDFHGVGKPDYDPFFGIVTLGTQHVASLKQLAQRRRALSPEL
ncbi:MAG: PHP domain-containing protein [Balneolaceae bacterium]